MCNTPNDVSQFRYIASRRPLFCVMLFLHTSRRVGVSSLAWVDHFSPLFTRTASQHRVASLGFRWKCVLLCCLPRSLPADLLCPWLATAFGRQKWYVIPFVWFRVILCCVIVTSCAASCVVAGVGRFGALQQWQSEILDSEFLVELVDSRTEGPRFKTFVTYNLVSTLCPTGVRRRYSDFEWLRDLLKYRFHGASHCVARCRQPFAYTCPWVPLLQGLPYPPCQRRR